MSDGKLTLLVPVERFPNGVQPWLLNSLEQILERGGDLWVASGLPSDPPHPQKVEALGLLERTLYIEPGSIGAVVNTLGLAFAPGPDGRRIRRGLRRLARSRRLLRGGTTDILNRLIKSPAFGLTGVDVVHSHALVYAAHYLEVARELDVPLVHSYHGLEPEGVPPLSDAWKEKVRRGVSRYLVNTRFAKRQLEALGFPGDKVEILPQGIVLSEFPYTPSAPALDRPVKLLSVGRLDPEKGFQYAIRALGKLSEEGVPAEYRIVGPGPYSATLREIAAEVGVQDRVTLTGPLYASDLQREFAEADIVLVPSVEDEETGRGETQAVVVQEAQASGKIVVATRTGGIPECVDDGVSAFLVDDRSPDDLARAVRSIVEHPDRWKEWQRTGRRWVEERFDASSIGERLWQLYHDIVAEHRGGGAP